MKEEGETKVNKRFPRPYQKSDTKSGKKKATPEPNSLDYSENNRVRITIHSSQYIYL